MVNESRSVHCRLTKRQSEKKRRGSKIERRRKRGRDEDVTWIESGEREKLIL